MNLKHHLLLVTTFIALSYSRLAFYTQEEKLSVLDDPTIPDISLGTYFEKRPKIFGLVTNKSRSHNREGYLCYAENYESFASQCQQGRLKNAEWVTNFNKCDLFLDCDPPFLKPEDLLIC